MQKKDIIFLDEDDNVLERIASIQCKVDAYTRKSAERIILGLKRSYFSKKEKEKNMLLVDNPEKYVRKVVMPVLSGDRSEADMGGFTVFVESEELAEVLESLNERQAKIIYLVFFVGDDPGVACKKMNMKRKTFNKNKRKAMKKIKKGLVKKGYGRKKGNEDPIS